MTTRILTIVNLICLTAAAYLGVGLFYKALGRQLATTPVVTAAVIPQAKEIRERPKAESHYRSILDRDLFKTKAVAAPVPEQKTELNLEALEQTKLKLKLWGTVAPPEEATQRSDAKAYAVIEDTTLRQQNLYRKGDSIQNASVKAILREKVILTVNGKDEILEMEKLQGGIGGPIRRSVASRSVSAAQVDSPRRAQRITLKRSLIEDSIQDITKLMTQVKITPHMEDGVPNGLALSNIQPNSIFRRMGLRNGDVLVGVDGQQIQSVDDALRLYDNLKTADSVLVDLKRRGREKSIEYNVK
ncbi:MAG: type II secretion system protein GspC [Desulfosarcinaceae bacterium]|nr:type II secretion system protein GspC [Desulfosarcinaceae bacterium]